MLLIFIILIFELFSLLRHLVSIFICYKLYKRLLSSKLFVAVKMLDFEHVFPTQGRHLCVLDPSTQLGLAAAYLGHLIIFSLNYLDALHSHCSLLIMLKFKPKLNVVICVQVYSKFIEIQKISQNVCLRFQPF